MKFHLDKNNQPAPCSATQRACPLGGEHFESMREATLASVEAELAPASPFVEGDYDNNLAVMNTDLVASQDLITGIASWIDSTRENTDLTEEQLDELATRLIAAGPDGDWESVNDDFFANLPHTDPFDDPYWDDFDDPFAEPEAWLAEQDSWRTDDDVDDDDFEDFAAAQQVYGGLPDDVAGQDEFAREKLKKSIQANIEFFTNAGSLGTFAIDETESERVAREFDSRQGRRQLVELADALEHKLREDKAKAQEDGTYVASSYYEDEAVVMSVRQLIVPPRDGRSRRRSEPRPIDPELIQALRLMYLKKFGVDPFESGVSVGELLAMLKSGELK